jgi:hypothetical protein
MSKPVKVKSEKKYTRAQAEKMLCAGADPSQFADHANIHVLKKSWMKMGQPESHNYVTRVKAKAAEKAAKETR